MPQVVDLRPKTKKFQPQANALTKIEWTAPEFTKYKKSKGWFVGLIFVTLIIIVIAVILKNFLWALLTIIAAFAVYIYATREPRKIKFSISPKGIQIDQDIHEFEDLKSFWIFYEPASPAGGPPEIKEISIRNKKIFMPYLKIPLGNQDPAEIRRLLLKFLPERKQKKSLLDEWARKIKF